jgi:hypothetical protein
MDESEIEREERLRMKREAILAAVIADGRFNESDIRDYVEEAEHQEGIGYWEQFDTADELIIDIELYQHFCEE